MNDRTTEETKGQLMMSDKLMKQLEKLDKLKQLCIIRQEKMPNYPIVKLKHSSRRDPTCRSLASLQQLKFWELMRKRHLEKL
jgi:hypothetical protein